MPTVDFIKMQGAGNDFVVLDALAHPLPANFDFSAATQQLCLHRWSIGGDGLLLLTTSEVPTAQARMRMWNPDGSEDMCGNGLRCVAALAHRRGYTGAHFTLQTLAGLREAHILADEQVRVSMGEPQFLRSQIPLEAPPENFADAKAVNYALSVAERTIRNVSSLSTGSTHTVIFGDHPSEAEFQRLSPLIENHAWFPERTSVLWAQQAGENHLCLRIWERGVGETLACGTGACAAAVAAQITGRGGETMTIESEGGVLAIEWRPGEQIFKTGPAQVVCEGKVEVR
jgi:diaminopimelate epimerase